MRELPVHAFGTLLWQGQVLDSYRKLVLSDPSLQDFGGLFGRRFGVVEVARAVVWLSAEGEEWGWIRELFRLVNGFVVEEAELRGGILGVV